MNFTKFIFIVLLFTFNNFANASNQGSDCVPMQGPYTSKQGFVVDPPRYFDPKRGCYVAQGTPDVSSQVVQGTGVQIQPNQVILDFLRRGEIVLNRPFSFRESSQHEMMQCHLREFWQESRREITMHCIAETMHVVQMCRPDETFATVDNITRCWLSQHLNGPGIIRIR